MVARSVLVVEDDIMISTFLVEMLEDLGYTVCKTAATEDDAVEAAALFAPDLMIVDQNLRDGTGTSVLDRVRQSRPVPCVLTSGAPILVDRPGLRVLLKPYLEHDLVRAISEVAGYGEPDAPVPSSGR